MQNFHSLGRGHPPDSLGFSTPPPPPPEKFRLRACIIMVVLGTLYRLSQQITTGLSASTTVKIMNQSEYASGFWNYMYN